MIAAATASQFHAWRFAFGMIMGAAWGTFVQTRRAKRLAKRLLAPELLRAIGASLKVFFDFEASAQI
jgi:hypothetical protein